jgi:hypothetical protein
VAAVRAGAPALARGRVKGAAFLEFVRWYERDQGRERLIAAAAGLSPPFRDALELDRDGPRILSSHWYDARAIHALLDALVDSRDAAERSRMAEEGARAIMSATLRGLYRLLFDWLATPERYARFADRLWRSYYDSGELEVVQADPTRAVSTIRNWPSHHPLLCEMHRHAADEIYTAMGCDGVSVRRESCVSQGDPECRFVTTWRG